MRQRRILITGVIAIGTVIAGVMVHVSIISNRAPGPGGDASSNDAREQGTVGTSAELSGRLQPGAAGVSKVTAAREQAEIGRLANFGQISVVDSENHAVAGADIWLVPETAIEFPPDSNISSVDLCEHLAISRGVTDEGGQAELSIYSDVTQFVVARKKGFAKTGMWIESHLDAPHGVRLKMELSPGLRGRVTIGSEGAGLLGAKITVIPRARPGRESEPREQLSRRLLGESISSAIDGEFALTELQPIVSELVCSSGGYLDAHVDWVTPRGQVILLKLGNSVDASGVVVDEKGAPVAGASVVIGTVGVLPIISTDPIKTNESGEFSVLAQAAARFEVKVDKVGYAVVKRQFDALDDKAPIEIQLTPEVEFKGVVVNSRGQPLQGAVVRVVDASQFVMCGYMETEADGSWFMHWVPAGNSIDLFVTRRGFDQRMIRGMRAPQSGLVIELAESSTVKGRVVTGGGVPIPEFMIRGASGGTPRAHEYFDRVQYGWGKIAEEHGLFEFGDLTPGPQEISVRAIGYRPITIDNIIVGPGEVVGPVEFRLERSPIIESAIVDGNHVPINGAIVEVSDVSFDGEPVAAVVPQGVVTNNQGRFAIDSVPSEPFALVVRWNQEHVVFSDLKESDFPREFVLERPGQIIGRVLGVWQQPETCVRIRISIDGTWVGHEVRPDGSGRFRIDELAPGDYRVELIDDWSEQERLRDGHVTRFVTVRSGETTELYLDATGTGVIEGRVDARDSGISRGRFVVRAFPPSGEGVALAEAYVDPMGTFRLDHLHGGTYRVRVSSYDRGRSGTLEREIVVRDDAVTGPVDFSFESGGLQGRVVRAEGGPADARVALIATTSGREMASVRTDRDGMYRVLGAPDGSYYILASAAGLADDAVGPAAFPATAGTTPFEQRLAKESRLIVIVKDDNHRPIADATVTVDVSMLPPQIRHRTMPSDGSGTAEFVRLPASTMSVAASRIGYVPADPVTVGLATDQRRTVEITLARCGSLEVTVKDERGQLFANAEVICSPANGDERGDATRRATTNSRGVVRFSGLRPMAYVVSSPGAGGATVTVSPGEVTSIEIALRR